jgi:methionine-gamma-lyase
MIYSSPRRTDDDIADIAALAKIAHENNAILVVDNTYCTPGIHARSNWEPTSSSIPRRSTSTARRHHRRSHRRIEGVHRTRKMEGLKDLTGATLAPFDAYLLLRGMKTLHIRVPRHCETAMKVARFLEGRPRSRRSGTRGSTASRRRRSPRSR